MKFIEAAPRMKHNDIFSSPDGVCNIKAINKGQIAGIWFVWDDGCQKPVSMTMGTLILEGEIIPAEPKVLTAEDYYTKTYGSFTGSINFSRSGLITVFNKGKENGRLERDLELRPVVDGLKEILEANLLPWVENKINDIIKNIPPLNKED